VRDAQAVGVVDASIEGDESVVSMVVRALLICGRVGSRESAENVLLRGLDLV
jgi:hypothetical protein